MLIHTTGPKFIPDSLLNSLRRSAVESLDSIRVGSYTRTEKIIVPNGIPFPQKNLDYRHNVANEKAFKFYRRHGAEVSASALETGFIPETVDLMKTKMCLKWEYGLCEREGQSGKKDVWKEPYVLSDKWRKYELSFDCKKCEMRIVLSG